MANEWWAHPGKNKAMISELLEHDLIWSLCLHYSTECPVVTSSPALPGLLKVVLAELQARNVIQQPCGGVCVSLCACPQRPCVCDSQDLCHCLHSTQNNFCCAVFFVSIVCGYFCLSKSNAPIWLFFWQMLFANCVGCFPPSILFSREYVSMSHRCSWFS